MVVFRKSTLKYESFEIILLCVQGKYRGVDCISLHCKDNVHRSPQCVRLSSNEMAYRGRLACSSRSCFQFLVVVVSLLCCSDIVRAAFNLTLLHTNDVHAHFEQSNTYAYDHKSVLDVNQLERRWRTTGLECDRLA